LASTIYGPKGLTMDTRPMERLWIQLSKVYRAWTKVNMWIHRQIINPLFTSIWNPKKSKPQIISLRCTLDPIPSITYEWFHVLWWDKRGHPRLIHGANKSKIKHHMEITWLEIIFPLDQ
jgi:hypothetical protein